MGVRERVGVRLGVGVVVAVRVAVRVGVRERVGVRAGVGVRVGFGVAVGVRVVKSKIVATPLAASATEPVVCGPRSNGGQEPVLSLPKERRPHC